MAKEATPLIPTFKTENGKFIYGRDLVEKLLSAFTNKQSSIQVEDFNISFVEEIKQADKWYIICKMKKTEK